MGSTEIEAVRTMSQIQEYLVRMGANQIATQFDEKTREPSALYFTMTIRGNSVPFQLPARVEPVFKIINGDGWGRDKVRDMAQAKRVAWRQIYRWIQAQLSLIETGMVEAEEVLMPYIQVAPNETLYQRAVSAGFQKLLPPPSES
jgi:hypothetical protein